MALVLLLAYALPRLLLVLPVQLPVLGALFLDNALPLAVRKPLGPAPAELGLELGFFCKGAQFPVYALLKVVEDLVLAHVVLVGEHLRVLCEADALVAALLGYLYDALHELLHIEVGAVEEAGKHLAELRLPHIRRHILRVVCEVNAGGEGPFPELVPVFGPAELMLDTVVDIHTAVDEPFPGVGEIRVRGHGHNALVIEPVEKLATVFLRILLAAYHPVGEALYVAPEFGPGAGRHGEEFEQIPLEVPLRDNRPRLLLVVGGIARAFLRTHYLVKRHALDVDILVVI